MSVDDNWGEALRKSAEQLVPGDKTEYVFRTRVLGSDSPVHSVSNGVVPRIVTTTLVPIISIRVTPGSSKHLELINASLFCATNELSLYQIVLNPTLVGPSWNVFDGVMEYDVAATAFTVGDIQHQEYFRSSPSLDSVAVLRLMSLVNRVKIDSGAGVISVVARTITGTGDFYGVISAREI